MSCRPVRSSRGIDRSNHPLNLRSNELDGPAVQALYSEILVFFILLPLNPFLDSEAGEGICHRSLWVVLPCVAHFFCGIGQVDVRKTVSVVILFTKPSAIFVHRIRDPGSRNGRSVVVLQEPHNARGIVDDNLVSATDDLPDLCLVIKKGGKAYLVVRGHPIDLRCRLPQFLATWPVFPLMRQISLPVHDRDGRDFIIDGVGPRCPEVKADDLRSVYLEMACHHAVTPTLDPGGNSERASDELDFICRSGYANLCHTPPLSHGDEPFNFFSTLTQPRLRQFGTVGATAAINSGRTYVVRLRTCRLPALFPVTICHPLAPNGPSRTHLREQNLSRGAGNKPLSCRRGPKSRTP